MLARAALLGMANKKWRSLDRVPTVSMRKASDDKPTEELSPVELAAIARGSESRPPIESTVTRQMPPIAVRGRSPQPEVFARGPRRARERLTADQIRSERAGPRTPPRTRSR